MRIGGAKMSERQDYPALREIEAAGVPSDQALYVWEKIQRARHLGPAQARIFIRDFVEMRREMMARAQQRSAEKVSG